MNIVERLREWAKNIRRKPAPLSDAIPMVCEAADRIEALEKQRDELLAALERALPHVISTCAISPLPESYASDLFVVHSAIASVKEKA